MKYNYKPTLKEKERDEKVEEIKARLYEVQWRMKSLQGPNPRWDCINTLTMKREDRIIMQNRLAKDKQFFDKIIWQLFRSEDKLQQIINNLFN